MELNYSALYTNGTGYTVPSYLYLFGDQQRIIEYFSTPTFEKRPRGQRNDVKIVKTKCLGYGVSELKSDVGWNWPGQTLTGPIGAAVAQASHPFDLSAIYAPQWMQDIAITEAFAKLSTPDVGGGETLGDFHQLVKMFTHPLAGSVKLLKKVFRDSKGRMRRSVLQHTGRVSRNLGEAMSDQWLEYRYGINPLAQDMAKAAFLFSQSSKKASNRLRISKHKVALSSSSVSQPFVKPVPGFQVTAQLKKEWEHEVTAKVYYRIRPYMDDAYLLAQLGISPTQIVSLIYELTPFSFVLDWFSNLGSWLHAIEPKPWLEVEECISSLKTTENFAWSCLSAQDVWIGKTWPIEPTPFFIERETLTRTTKARLPLTPAWRREHLSIKHQLDALALTFKSTVGKMLGHVSKDVLLPGKPRLLRNLPKYFGRYTYK
jgi:hypothetical protein